MIAYKLEIGNIALGLESYLKIILMINLGIKG